MCIRDRATVSLILNNSDKITFSSETKERVLTAAQQLGYKLPQRKKQQEKRSSHMLLVLTPTLTNQYYAELIQAIEEMCIRDRAGVCQPNFFCSAPFSHTRILGAHCAPH